MVNIITKYQFFWVFIRKIVPFCRLHTLYISRGKTLSMPSYFCIIVFDDVENCKRFLFCVDIKSRRWYIIK